MFKKVIIKGFNAIFKRLFLAIVWQTSYIGGGTGENHRQSIGKLKIQSIKI